MRTYDSGSKAVQRYMRSRAARREAGAEPEEPITGPALSVETIGPDQYVPSERAHEAIDLLNDKPATIVDLERMRWALAFGFAGGDIGGVLLHALRRAPVAASDWKAEAFANGLFVQELVRICMRPRLVTPQGTLQPSLDTTFVARVLTHPPRAREVVEHRRAIVRELAEHAALRTSFEALYRALHALRALLDAVDVQGAVRELDGRRRRLEVLASVRDVLAQMAGFAGCTSGLSRIHRFAAHAMDTDAYRHLVDLLDYDNHLASVDLQLRVGSDGHIRHFAITRVSENRGNRFYRTPFGRFLTRVGLLLRGFSLGEPEVLNSWIDAAFEGVQHVLPALLQLLGEMEVYLAVLAFKDAAESKDLAVCLPDLHESDDEGPRGSWAYEQLFNPLLFAHTGPITPCDLAASAFRSTTLVTGPNSGGKTRLLQAVAIAQMLGQSGFYAPAARASLERASGLFVSLIEEARADQKEGRLGTELIRIRELFESAQPGSLIVLDELCSGTNPSEGEDIIRLVLSLLGELHASVFITTHFLQFATRLSEEPHAAARLRFLQVELDAHEQPTYRFVPGVAQTSLAHRTAARLGVTREELLALIERNTRRQR